MNIAQISGIAYSTVMLGVLLPKLNIWMTRKNGNTNIVKTQNISFKSSNFSSFEEFDKK